MQDRSFPLRPQARSAFIIINGEREAAEVLANCKGLGVTEQDLADMVREGLIEAVHVPEPPTTDATADVPPEAQPLADHARYLRAYPIAVELTASLGLRGFRLNLAVEAAGNLAQLQALSEKIEQAVGASAFLRLKQALES